MFGAPGSGSCSSGGLFGATGAASGSSAAGIFGAACGSSSGSANTAGGIFGATGSGTMPGMGFGAGSAGASGGSTASLQQMQTTVIEHRKVKDTLRMWEEEIHKQAEHFEAFGTQILQVDTEIIANAANIKQLKTEHGQLKS